MSKGELSYVCGSSLEPLEYRTVGKLLRDTSRRFGQNEALVSVHQSVRYTYEQLDEIVDRYAAGLLALGLEKGDRLGIWSPNNVEWIITQFATARAGVILVNINPAYRLSELEYALNKTECKAIVLAERFKTSDYVGMLRELAPEIDQSDIGQLHAKRLPHLRFVAAIGDTAPTGFCRFSDIERAATAETMAQVQAFEGHLDPDDPINIQFTSGTTGFPKGATLSHHSIVNNAKFCAAVQRYTSQDRVCIPVPLYHCFGMVLGVLACANVGATIVLPDEAFEPDTSLQTVQDEKCTSLYGVPTMFIAELELLNFTSYDLSSLRTGIMAGSPCPSEIMKRVISDMNMVDVTIGYGMTELSPLSFQTSPEDGLEKRVSTVGRAHPFVETKIVDINNKVVPRGVQGEVLTRGYSVMIGYWNDPERTAESKDEEGWMRTGDLGVMDDEGYLKITGRSKDMIIRGGENIYPREIEEFLHTHPAVADVQVFGVPDNKYGEEVCAWVMLKPDAHLDADGLKAFCKGQIAHFKVPRFIRFVSEYPMTVTGKIQKFVMRDRMVEELEGTSSEKTTNTEKQSSNEQGSEAVFKNLFKKEAKPNGQAEYPLTINGKNVAGADTLGVVNPATGEVFAMVSRANAEQAHEAIAAAENAFDDWSKTPMTVRQERLLALADALNERGEEISRVLTQEQGKPLTESQMEVAYTEAFLRHFATLNLDSEVVQDDETFHVTVNRKPLGVVAAITPWNFPILIPGFKVAMAIVTGNTAVLKPSPYTPISAMLLGQLCNDVLPPGVVNVIVDNDDLGPILSKHPKIAKVSFTGSTDTGKKIMASSASTLKRITLELGGNDAGIVLPDVDVKETAQKIFDAAFMNCGQVCICLKRAYVPDEIYDEMVEELAKLANAAIVDDGLQQGTQIGPLQNKAQYEKVLGYLDAAKADGKIAAGGDVLDRPGYFMRPTIVKDIKEGSRLVDEEQFGPILPVIRYSEGEDVVARANNSEYGLGGSVWSKQVDRAVEIAGQVEAGTVWVNQHLYFAPNIPFAGAKNSGIGVEFAKEGLEEFTQIQVINIAK